jgi:DNA-binding transcriptional LysR family regulator
MDLRRLRTFVTVAELGTVTRAASRLCVSQPALSRQIYDLEQEFNIKLFDRVGRRLMLTALGEQVLDDCRRILGEVGSLRARLELLRRGGSGALKVAAPPQTIESVLSRFLPGYSARFPNVRVMLTEALGHEQLTLLERMRDKPARVAISSDIVCQVQSRSGQTIHRIAERGRFCGTKRKGGNHRNPRVDRLPDQGSNLGPAD